MQNKTLENLINNPSEISSVMSNPGKYGMDFYNELTPKQKQYVLIAAGVGLIAYAIYLGRQQKS